MTPQESPCLNAWGFLLYEGGRKWSW